MSNLVYDGLYFQNELSAKWKLTNVLAPMPGETQEIRFGIFNNVNAGFEFVGETPEGLAPNFLLRQKNDITQVDLLKFDGALDQLSSLKPFNVLPPTQDTHATSKIYVDTAVAGYVPPPLPISLVGDVSGSGTTGADITTTFTKKLNQIPNQGDVSLAGYKLKDVSPPVLATDGANKNYVDSRPLGSFTITSDLDMTGFGVINAREPLAGQDLATKHYIDTKTWISSQITNFGSSVISFRLDQFARPVTPMYFNGQPLRDIAAPTFPQDAVTLGFLSTFQGDINSNTTGSLVIDRLAGYPASESVFLRGDGVWSITPDKTISLSGDVSGSGTTGAAIITTFNKTLNQIQNAGDINCGMYKLASVANPTLSFDAANKDYVDSKTWSALQIIDFSSAVTSFRLNQFEAPTSDLNLGSQKIINLANPVLTGDAVNLGFLQSYTFDINTKTTGNLALSRLFGFPNSTALYLRGDGTWSSPQGSGNVVGPAASTSNAIPTFSDISGKVLKNNGVTIESDGRIGNVANPVFANDVATRNFAETHTITPSRISGYPYNGSKFLGGDGSWKTPTVGDPLFIGDYAHIDSNTNFLTWRGDYTYQSNMSTVIESRAGGETGSIVLNGNYMQFITPMDILGFIFTDEDTSTQSSYVAYINSAGDLIKSSSQHKKHSLRRKQHKDYLERLNQLNIYSYGLNYELAEEDSQPKRQRKQEKSTQLHVGVLAEEVLGLFDNATNIDKRLEGFETPQGRHSPFLGVNFNVLLCYTILALQELSQQVEGLKQRNSLT